MLIIQLASLKRAQVLAIPMRNLEFQIAKKARPETDPKSVILKEYYDFLGVFSEKDLDKLPFY